MSSAVFCEFCVGASFGCMIKIIGDVDDLGVDVHFQLSFVTVYCSNMCVIATIHGQYVVNGGADVACDVIKGQ